MYLDSYFVDPILDQLEADVDSVCDFAKTQNETLTFMTDEDFFEPERERELHTAAELRRIMEECDSTARRIFEFRNSLGVKLLTQTVSMGYRNIPAYKESGINWNRTDPEKIRAQIKRMIQIVRHEEHYGIDEERNERIMESRRETDAAMKDKYHVRHPNNLILHPTSGDYEMVNIFGTESREVEEVRKQIREKGWTLFHIKRGARRNGRAMHLAYGIGDMIPPFFYMDEVGCGVHSDIRKDFAQQMIKCLYYDAPNAFAGIGDVVINVDEGEESFIEKIEEHGFKPVSRITSDERPTLLMHYDKRSIR